MRGKGTKLARYDGTIFEQICGKITVVDPAVETEIVESEELLDGADCAAAAGGSVYQQKAPGTISIADMPITVELDPATYGPNNERNHHLFEADSENQTAALWRLTYPNGVGKLIHAFVSKLGESELSANDQITREFTLTPTGRLRQSEDIVEAFDVTDLPADIRNPTLNYTG